MQTPTLSPIKEVWNDPFSWQFVTFIAVLSLAAAILALIIQVLIVIIKSRIQKRRRDILAKDSNAGSYPMQVIENATRYYVRPFCSNLDPANEPEIRNSIATSQELFSFVDKFLDSRQVMGQPVTDTVRHLIILADSGMGKTSFVLNYFSYNLRKRIKIRKRLAIVHLGSADALEKISALERKSETDLILDALDEDTLAVGAPDAHRNRLMEIFRVCASFKHIVITCRTQFFPRDDEIPKSTGIVVIESRSLGQQGHYELRKIYLDPLTDDQVDEYLIKRYPGYKNKRRREKAIDTVLRIPLLTARPMLLSYIPDLLESNHPIDHIYQLYEVMVEKWLERERTWVGDTQKLREFSEEMAVDIYTRKDERGAEKIPREELLKIAKEKGVELEDWQVTGRSLLNRDAEGNFKFAHRSIMEYLFIKQYLSGNVLCRGIKWTDLMKQFLLEMTQPNFLLPLVQPSNIPLKKNAYYEEFFIHLNGSDLSDRDLQEHFYNRLPPSREKDVLLNVSEVGDFCNADLRNIVFPHLRFILQILYNVDLSGCIGDSFTFFGSSFRDVSLEDSTIGLLDLRKVNVRDLNLKNCRITTLDARRASFSNVDLQYANIDFLHIDGASMQTVNLNECKITKIQGLDADISAFSIRNGLITELDINDSRTEYLDLRGSRIEHFKARKALLSDINLQDALIGDLELSYAKIQSLDLERAQIKQLSALGTDLTNVKGLMPANIKTGFFNYQSRFPDYFRYLNKEMIVKFLDGAASQTHEDPSHPGLPDKKTEKEN